MISKLDVKEINLFLSESNRIREEKFLRGITDNYKNKLIFSQHTCTDGDLVQINPIHPFIHNLQAVHTTLQKMKANFITSLTTWLILKIFSRSGEAHEGFHILFTDFRVLKRMEKDFENQHPFKRKIMHDIMNIGEDSFIELAGINYLPGLEFYITFGNLLAYENTPSLEEIEVKCERKELPWIHLFLHWAMMYSIIGQVKGKVKNTTIKRYIKKTAPIFDKIRYEKNCDKRYDYAKEIFHIVEELVNEVIKDYNNMPDFDYFKNKNMPKLKEVPNTNVEIKKDFDTRGGKNSQNQQSDGKDQNDEEITESDSSNKQKKKKDKKKEDSKQNNKDSNQGKDTENKEDNGKDKDSENDKDSQLQNGDAGTDNEDNGQDSEKEDMDNENKNTNAGEDSQDDNNKDKTDESDETGKSNESDESDESSKSDESDESDIEKKQKELEELLKELEMEKDTVEKEEYNRQEMQKREEELEKRIQRELSKVQYSQLHRDIRIVTNKKFQPLPKQEAIYERIFKQHRGIIERFANMFLKLIKDQDESWETKQMIGSVLDTRRLADNKRRFWKKEVDKKEVADLCIQLLIDGSSSMENKVYKVIQATIILYEVAKKLNIPICIVEERAIYSSPKVVHNVLVDYRNYKNSNTKYNLLHLTADEGTREGVSLKWVSAYQNLQPNKDKLLIVLADGNPEHTYAGQSYTGSISASDTRKVAEQIEKKGTRIVAIALGEDCFPYLKQIYKNTILCDNLSKLPDQMIRVLKRHMFK